MDLPVDSAFRVCVSCPPRHGKTELILHAITRLLLMYPDRTAAYIGYGAQFAQSKSRTIRRLATQAGLQILRDTNSVAEWRTPEGGGLIATGIRGPLTGKGCQWLFIDDPLKSREEAESATIRERNWEWYQDVGRTRLEPRGSVCLVQTRWHTDDLYARMCANDPAVKAINCPAISDDGKALWAERWPLPKLEALRQTTDPYSWESMYQGRPFGRGGSVFEGATTYDTMPPFYRVCIGVDFAYTARSHADYSVAVVMGESGGRMYIMDVVRRQCTAPEFAADLARLRAMYDNAPLVCYAAGTERGAIDFMGRPPYNTPMKAMPAVADKFTRAQRASGSWAAQKIAVKAHAPWRQAFLAEINAFTGVGDIHDDCVDAMVAAHDCLVRPTQSLDLSDFEPVRPRL